MTNPQQGANQTPKGPAPDSKPAPQQNQGDRKPDAEKSDPQK